VDSAAAPSLIDSLGRQAALLIERLDDPWRRIAELDDSLAGGVRLIVAASTSSDRFDGPRPTVARAISWIPVIVTRPMPATAARGTRSANPLSTIESRALRAAAAAVAEEFGPLRDTTGWRDRLPDWWRDSLATAGFPVAAAHALLPVGSLPAPVPLATAQLLPRPRPAVRGGPAAMDPHWWVWGLVLALFIVERFWALHRRGRS
jgi:hypothetical protein